MSLHTAIRACSIVSPALRMETPVICEKTGVKNVHYSLKVSRQGLGFASLLGLGIMKVTGVIICALHQFLPQPQEGDRGGGTQRQRRQTYSFPAEPLAVIDATLRRLHRHWLHRGCT